MEVTEQLPERRVPTRGGPWGMSLSEAGRTRRGLLLPLSALNLIRYFFLSLFFLWPRLTCGGPRHKKKKGQVVGVRWRWGVGVGGIKTKRALLLLITGFLSGALCLNVLCNQIAIFADCIAAPNVFDAMSIFDVFVAAQAYVSVKSTKFYTSEMIKVTFSHLFLMWLFNLLQQTSSFCIVQQI